MYIFQQSSIAHVYISTEQHRPGSGYPWERRPQTNKKYGQVNLRTSEPRTSEPQKSELRISEPQNHGQVNPRTSEPQTSDHEPFTSWQGYYYFYSNPTSTSTSPMISSSSQLPLTLCTCYYQSKLR